MARRLVLAAIEGREVRLNYHSLTSGTRAEAKSHSTWLLVGTGIVGTRRAWCCENEEWRDFVLGRIEAADWPGEVVEDLSADEKWTRMEVVRLVINPKLKKESREALRLDYGLAGEVLEIRVRAAMKPYLLAGLFLDEETGRNLQRHFVLG